jgi:cysteinyl-tRNA synthetase
MKVYNTLSGKKEEFSPQGKEVRMYVCGVTPYDEAHIGHAMSYIIFDVIRRYLRFRNYKVSYVQNVTDIDDKIIDRAAKLGIKPAELAQKYTDSFDEDMKNLNVTIVENDIYPRATEEIPKIIEVIAGLVDKGFAYPAGGSVYFRVKQDPDYGKLSHRSLEAMRAAECAIGGEEKEDAMDFALWKASKPGEPFWESPWGQGRPGWHIECSAMSLKYLGDQIDIHGGGQDLIFPHHENEIAQSESFTGKKPFVKYWLHNGLLQFGEDKMSKSLGNLITIKEALSRYSPDAIRIFVLSSHYRSPLTYSEEALEAAKSGADRLRGAISRQDSTGGKGKALDAAPYDKQFKEAMNDDFKTAQALAVLFDLASAIYEASDKGLSFSDAQNTLLSLAQEVLGLKLGSVIIKVPVAEIEMAALAPTVVTGHIPSTDIEELVKLLVSARQSLRNARQWSLADKIRATLGKSGITIEDGQTGPSAINYGRKLSKEPTKETQLLVELLGALIDEMRVKLDELGITLEDTAEGSVWKRKR